MDINDETKEDFLKVKLALSFGTLNRESMRSLSDEQKIAVMSATKGISKIKTEERTWENVTGALAQNVILEPADDPIHRSDILVKEGSDFNFNGAPNEAVISQVKSWFAYLISDEDLLQATPINTVELANIVQSHAQTFVFALSTHEHH